MCGSNTQGRKGVVTATSELLPCLYLRTSTEDWFWIFDFVRPKSSAESIFVSKQMARHSRHRRNLQFCLFLELWLLRAKGSWHADVLSVTRLSLPQYWRLALGPTVARCQLIAALLIVESIRQSSTVTQLRVTDCMEWTERPWPALRQMVEKLAIVLSLSGKIYVIRW